MPLAYAGYAIGAFSGLLVFPFGSLVGVALCLAALWFAGMATGGRPTPLRALAFGALAFGALTFALLDGPFVHDHQ